MMTRSFAFLVPALAIALVPARSTFDMAAETARIRTHLATAEAELRRADVSVLTDAQRRARLRNLDVLHQYWVHGVFPVNTDFPGHLVPYFVDRFGTRCAMAYLIERSGRGDLVARIAGTHNAYIGQLKGDAELGAWLRDNGLSVAEAARIQPTYRSPVEDFTGRWEGVARFRHRDSTSLQYVMNDIPSDEPGGINYAPPPRWRLTFADHDPVTLRVVTFGGDSLVMQSGPLTSAVGLGVGVTSLRTTMHYGGSVLTGTIEIGYSSGAIARAQTRATLDCPGPPAPRDVVAFVRHADLSKVRCVMQTGSLLNGQGMLFSVTYRVGSISGDPATRFVLRWRTRVRWLLPEAGPVPDTLPDAETFRAGPRDTALVAPAVLKGMTTFGQRLPWARTLLSHPDVPRFILLGLIAALQDTVDEGLANLLVTTPAVTQDPRLMATLAHLPVAPDSELRNRDGSTAYITAATGYAGARDAADIFLWNHALALIAAPGTSNDVLLTIATWDERHRYMCGGGDPRSQIFAALRARATQDRDTTILAALARAHGICG
ncbi:MAG TPA: hypothetical protein VEV39_06090 [Gemmatimonadales bacterium]|nr:hypothetical protein [Gemmatimonadales bacterium]